MAFVIHEAGCGKKAMRICFMKNIIYPIIIDVIITMVSIDFKKFFGLLIASTSMSTIILRH
ncbi:MAG: hypothetical protein ACFFA3_14310 [Promethearchaeota archaeon]